MLRPRPLPDELPSHAFTVAGALAAGVTRRRLRGRDLEAPFFGVRSRARPLDVASCARIYSVKLRVGEFFSHGSALALAGVPVPARLSDAIDITAVRPVGRPRGRGVRGHEGSADALRVGVVGRVPAVHPVDAWCQLAAELSVHELVVIGDALTRRKRPIASLEELEAAVQRWAGRRGVARLREALALVRPRTDSVRETELRLAASDFGLPEPEVNGRILDDDGRFVAFGDLVYRRWRVILEYDGEQHRTDERQFARDVERLDDLARLGWRVVRVSKQHRGPRRIQRLRRVHEALIERGWSPNTTP